MFDGGMSSEINLEAMSAAGLGYVTRLSASTLRSLVAELDLEKQLELGDRQKLMEITHQSKRYVIAGGQWRQQRDQERRQSRIDKAEVELKRLAAVQRKKVDVQKLASKWDGGCSDSRPTSILPTGRRAGTPAVGAQRAIDCPRSSTRRVVFAAHQ